MSQSVLDESTPAGIPDGSVASGGDEPSGWWARPCGGREVLYLALPLVVSTMSWTIMNFVDRMMLLWHSQEEMAAAARDRVPTIEIEATGGLTLEMARVYAEYGADFLSVGAITHSVIAADVALEIRAGD